MKIRKKQRVFRGDCLDILEQFPDNYFHAVIHDPPYGIDFMNKKWDTFKNRDHFIKWMAKRQKEILRVLRPGGFQVACAGSRTMHWTIYAIESAGFDIDDLMIWLYSQGFPKGLNVAKAIQKKQGVKPIAKKKPTLGFANNAQWNALHNQLIMPPLEGDALEWDGFNTTLRPMYEGIPLAQKPLSEKTVADNVLRWGVGALNIRAAAIGNRVRIAQGMKQSAAHARNRFLTGQRSTNVLVSRTKTPLPPRKMKGRWPGNIIIDEEIARETLDRRGIERFYFCPKPSREEKEAGCSHLKPRTASDITNRKPGSKGAIAAFTAMDDETGVRRNDHPTCKPIALMRWLVRLLCPPGGIVLDAFCGSGTTGVACVEEDARFVGIDLDMDDRYVKIAEARIEHARLKKATRSKGLFE